MGLVVELVGLAFEEVEQRTGDGEIVAALDIEPFVELAVVRAGGGIGELCRVVVALHHAALHSLFDIVFPVGIHFGQMDGETALERVAEALPFLCFAAEDDITGGEGRLADVDGVDGVGELLDHLGVDVLLRVIRRVERTLTLEFSCLRVRHVAPGVGDDIHQPHLHDLGSGNLVGVSAIGGVGGFVLLVGVEGDDLVEVGQSHVEIVEIAVVHRLTYLVSVLLSVVALHPLLAVGQALATAEPQVVDVVHRPFLSPLHDHV